MTRVRPARCTVCIVFIDSFPSSWVGPQIRDRFPKNKQAGPSVRVGVIDVSGGTVRDPRAMNGPKRGERIRTAPEGADSCGNVLVRDTVGL
ncbi:hypothetical protein JCM14469_22680 [Desulfatiferula olefinivorans]